MDRYEVTALIASHHRSRLGTWTDGRTDSRGRIKVVETFSAPNTQDARLQMCRLLVPLGIAIFDTTFRHIPATF